MNKQKIKELHDLIISEKMAKRISFKSIGELIKYSPEGVSKALKNNTLKVSQLKLIAEEYDFLEKFNDCLTKDVEANPINLNELAANTLLNWDVLMDRIPAFKKQVDLIVVKKVNEELVKIIKNDDYK